MFYFLSNWESLANNNIIENIAGVERSIFGNILNVVRIAGTGIALIMLAWMSFSYFAADGKSMPGAPEIKADVKGRQLINFAIGAGIFIGASNLLYFFSDFIADIVEAIFK